MHWAPTAPALDVESVDTDSVVSYNPEGHPLRLPGGGFTLPKLISLIDKVAFNVWKNTIGYFCSWGRPNHLIMPVAYQSLQGNVALLAVTLGPNLTLHELVAGLDDSFDIVSDEDTLTKELYSIQQGNKVCQPLWYLHRVCHDMLNSNLPKCYSSGEDTRDKEVPIPRGTAWSTQGSPCMGAVPKWEGKKHWIPVLEICCPQGGAMG